MSPAREEDDASTSPHLNTFINSKAQPEAIADGEVHMPSSDEHKDAPGSVGEHNGSDHEMGDGDDHQCKDISGDKPDANALSCEPSEPNEAIRRSSSTNGYEYIPAKLSFHSRVPSAASSIPHMLGQRLSFLGLDAELPSTSLDNSVASSGDLERSEHMHMRIRSSSPYLVQSNATPIGYQAIHQNQNVFRLPDNQQAPSNSNVMSPAGVPSRNANKNHNEQTYNTPPYHLGSAIANATVSPPYKVSQETLNGQPPQHLADQLQYQLSPEIEPSIESPCRKGDLNEPSKIQDNLIQRKEASPVPGQTIERERRSEPIPNHDVRRTRKQPVQPVLYSAINSLERYNEGSFDSKMLYAKAFAKSDDQNAFPGIPAKTPLKPAESTDSAADTWSSTSTELNRAKDITTETETVHFRVEISSSGEEKAMDERGTQQRHANLESSFKKVVRSKSSSNLSDSAVNGTDRSIIKDKPDNRVTIVECDKPKRRKRREKKEKKVGVFRPTGDAYTPRMGTRPIKYKPAQERESVDKMSSTMGTIQRPNFRDALRRVAIILHQHIVKIEHRFETGVRGVDDTGLFKSSRRDEFSEDKFATPRYKCSMVRVPMACPGVVYSMRKIRVDYRTPSTDEIYDFAHQLFKKVQLSSECSIVCLIYVEKLMEVAKVPLVASTWRPIFMCGLLLASKVWQDLSSWNIEFASVYPQFSLEAINRLEVQFLKAIKWDLYISSR